MFFLINNINPINPIVHFWYPHTAHSLGSAWAESGGQGERVGSPLVHMAAARLGCKLAPGGSILGLAAWGGLENAGIRWVNSLPGCMRRLRKPYSHLSGGSFLAGKASWSLIGCLPIESADHCMLVNEWAWLTSRVSLLRLKVELGSLLESELGQKRRYCASKAHMHMLKLISSEKFRV